MNESSSIGMKLMSGDNSSLLLNGADYDHNASSHNDSVLGLDCKF